MKVAFIALFSILSFPSTGAIGLRGLFNKISGKIDAIVASQREADAELAAFLEAPAAVANAGEGRDLQVQPDCETAQSWHSNHPTETSDWQGGVCILTATCENPGYPTQLECCVGAFPDQRDSACYVDAGFAPTASPSRTPGSEAEFYYPDYSTAWEEAECVNLLPLPFGEGDRPTYPNLLACCRGSYAGQVSGKCVSALPSPPTTSPSMSAGFFDFWYPDYETSWAQAGCTNVAPLPYPRKEDRPSFPDMLACCIASYAEQPSGACLAMLPSPPTISPTMAAGSELDFFFPDPVAEWANAGCTNVSPYPEDSGLPTYDTMLECCNGFYGGQVSGACIGALPSPPTTSPILPPGSELDFFFPDPVTEWANAGCTNVSPYPEDSGLPTYDTMLECCNGFYGGQVSGVCIGALPSPPTASPILPAGSELDFFFPDPVMDWSIAGCTNVSPYPEDSGLPTYDTMLECCNGSYGGQVSGVCIGGMPR